MKKSYYTLITGAGQGLGKELALECARRGNNLILVSLKGEGLHELAANVQLVYRVDAIAIEMDLCEEGNCSLLFHQVQSLGLEVNMLINNAGIGSTELFGNGNLAEFETQIKLNVLATTLVTHKFLEMLKQNAPSYILNVGSLASFFSLPRKQVYGGTKSFVSYFTNSLRREVRKESVFVSLLCPGGMFTNAIVKEAIKNGSYFSRASSMQPRVVAVIALNGLLQKKSLIIPGKINNTIVFLKRLTPGFIVNYFEEITMKKLQSPRKTNAGIEILASNQLCSIAVNVAPQQK